MSIDVKQLKLYVIIPVLEQIDLYSDSSVNLLLGTCAQESEMGTYLKQINGPALGIYQIEPNTHNDVWDNYLVYKPELRDKVLRIGERNSNSLIVNLAYQTAIARIIYLRVANPLPTANDIPGLANYYKKYYNTVSGKAILEEVIEKFRSVIG